MKFGCRFWGLLLCSGFITLMGSGCLTNEPTGARAQTPNREIVDIIRVGDRVKVDFAGTSSPPPPHEEEVKHDGTISLAWIGPIKAEGKTLKQLQDDIKNTYVPRFYQNLNVVVNPLNRFYYVGGEVKIPKREIYAGQITVLQAIQSAGDFTDFANRSNITLTRANGQIIKVDANEARTNPNKDPEVFPGDRIHVDRRFF